MTQSLTVIIDKIIEVLANAIVLALPQIIVVIFVAILSIIGVNRYQKRQDKKSLLNEFSNHYKHLNEKIYQIFDSLYTLDMKTFDIREKNKISALFHYMSIDFDLFIIQTEINFRLDEKIEENVNKITDLTEKMQLDFLHMDVISIKEDSSIILNNLAKLRGLLTDIFRILI